MADPILFACPHCQGTMHLHERHLDARVPCPHCGREVDTPAPETLEALGAFGGGEPSGADEPRPLQVPHFAVGCFLPALMAGYGLVFGVIQRRLWFGARQYGGGNEVTVLTGNPAFVMGIGFTVAAVGLHLSGIWSARYPSRVSDRLATFIAGLGVFIIFGSLILFATQPPAAGD